MWLAEIGTRTAEAWDGTSWRSIPSLSRAKVIMRMKMRMIWMMMAIMMKIMRPGTAHPGGVFCPCPEPR